MYISVWPLEVGCTVSEEDGREAECVKHGNESTAVSEPILLGATETGSIVQHTIRESFPFTSDHVSKLIH